MRKTPSVARAAALITAGQIASRVLGFGGDALTAALFGRTGATDAFYAAETVSQTVYDLLVGTTITSALIPVFSDHADKRDLTELWRLASVVITVACAVLSVIAALLIVFAPQVMGVVVHFPNPSTQELAVPVARLVMPSFVFLGLSGVVSSLLYAMRKFAYSAFCVAAFNGAIVVSALLLHDQLGVRSLALGMVIGSVLMVAIQLPPLIQSGMRFRPSLNLRQPEVRRIGRLYLPVAAGMVITIIQIVIDRHLASSTGEGNISAMQYATKIVQLPLGLISTALGVAILPTLARHALEPTLASYKEVLTRGLKLVLALIVPMTVAVLVLNNQILALVYQHGQYTAADRQVTSLALYLYAPELPFAAVDYLLISAFYALKNTLVPALIGVLGVAVYLVVALTLVGRMGFTALVIANTLKDSIHGVVLLVLLWRLVGGLRGYTVARSALKMVIAGAGMAVIAFGTALLVARVTTLDTLPGQVAQLAIAGGAGAATYIGIAALLKVDELALAYRMISARLRPA